MRFLRPVAKLFRSFGKSLVLITPGRRLSRQKPQPARQLTPCPITELHAIFLFSPNNQLRQKDIDNFEKIRERKKPVVTASLDSLMNALQCLRNRTQQNFRGAGPDRL